MGQGRPSDYVDDKLGVSAAGSAGSRATATLTTDVHSMIAKGQLTLLHRSWFGG